ncbi:indole-3-glycerol phosphate synthase TrpC [Actinomyces sp. B33]|uniref:indole-3-glycerol phosphate synthase TrpC n=1 Tax=Actinomyces sp. B33 TaxID=2942131 RepID=UPI002341F2A6|nr:indole-3-glycerol phosphate synthase TrpC [Actinomyces sp. B33]MDC4233251.1 indole-3-glycerol phosphate synthase TrpC [Actinomyces sp. B33]
MTVLDVMIAGVLADLEARQAAVPMDEVKRSALRASDALDACAALRSLPGAVKIIAEVKRASPVNGTLAPIRDPGELAARYEEGGAAIVSVFTEPRAFLGALSDLDAVRASVDVPVLRKDFILTPYQIHESRAHGADLVLLTAAVLEQPALVSLLERVHSLGMEAIVEAHSRLEALRAVDAGARVIGVNACDLTTLEIDRDVVEQVIDVIPEDVIAVAESGVRGPHDVFEYAKSGADAVLVGSALVTSATPRQCVADMVAAGQHPALLSDRKARVRAAHRVG